MTSSAKRKGDRYERDVAHALAQLGLIGVERSRSLGAPADVGDLYGVSGWLVDCKDRVSLTHLSGWLDEAIAEAAAARDHVEPAVALKRARRPIADGYLVTTLGAWARQLVLIRALRERCADLERQLAEVTDDERAADRNSPRAQVHDRRR